MHHLDHNYERYIYLEYFIATIEILHRDKYVYKMLKRYQHYYLNVEIE